MIDINRCLLLTTQPPMNRLKNTSHFSTMLKDLCEIVPAPYEDLLSMKCYKHIEVFCRGKQDSGISLEAERKSLVYALLSQV